MKEKRVYLSGAMLDCTDAECRDWREFAKENIGGVSLDPMIQGVRNAPLLRAGFCIATLSLMVLV